MNDKKHIDRLFQEKLKDIEVTPGDAVWNNINTALQEDSRDRKVIPLWMKLSGIAVGLALLFLAGNLILSNDDATVPQQVVDDTETETNPGTDNNTQKNTGDDTINLTGDDNTDVASEGTDDTLNSEGNTPGANEDANNGSSNLLQNESYKRNKSDVASQDNKDNLKEKASVNKTGNDLLKKNDTDRAVTENDKPSDLLQNKEQLNTINKDKADALVKDGENNADTNVAQNDTSQTGKQEEADNATNTEKEKEKLALTDAIVNADDQEDVDDEEEETDMKRWSVAPNIAPVYFNTLGKGSSIHSQFDSNHKSGNINMSYGIAAAYKINDKLSVRGGISQVTLGYSTDDVVVYNNVTVVPDDVPTFKNIRFNEYGQNLSFISADQFNFAQLPGVLSNNVKSSIDQKLGFIEVPIELEYKISDKKFGISVIGGFSTLFLNQNEVYSNFDGQKRLLGEATNINKTSFSANLGVGFDVQLSEKFNLNLEPVFKYQLNTFSDTTGDFNPYFIGVYTGFSFKF